MENSSANESAAKPKKIGQTTDCADNTDKERRVSILINLRIGGLCSEGTFENSPQFQLRVRHQTGKSRWDDWRLSRPSGTPTSRNVLDKRNGRADKLKIIRMYAPPPYLNLVVLRSSDIEKAASFYRQMGLLFTRHSHGSGPEHYTSMVNGMVFEIYPLTPKSSPTTGTRIGFSVDSTDEVTALLEKIGAVVVTPPADSEWGRRAAVKEFDGHIVELVTPKDRKY